MTETTDQEAMLDAATAAEQPAETPTADSAAEEAPAAEADTDELADNFARMLAEAEQRGYLRARNEIARAAMRKPRLWSNERRDALEPEARPAAENHSLDSDFLSRITPGVWD